ncbi:alpha/beta hydrolase [Halosolutus halophilus]|uniref:alpha/beta hydrolase n=1 Tax=Halosolutus halophilus TaxID=1552990 RepID=UPI0022352960|nr:alpha/beta fold hydrolase [Halosolutus halophilus]
MASVRRRRVLATLSSAALSATAGCTELLGDGSDEAATPESDAPETIEEAAILFVEDLAADRIETAYDRLRSDAQVETDLGELERIWMGYTAVGGAFESVVDTDFRFESTHNALDVTMAFDRTTDVLRVLVDADLEIAGLYFNGEYESPAYVDADAIAEADVTLEPWGAIESPPANSCPLDGRLTTPIEEDDVPGAVLVHDSGRNDMNYWRPGGGTRAFQDLAEGLATRGIATLRYDERTFACPMDVPAEDHTLDAVTADDALVAIERLRDVEGVDPDRIVVVGLGLGGMAAPRIADRDGNLAGVVALAAPGRPFHEVILDGLEHRVTVGEYEWNRRALQYERWQTEVERIRAGDYEPDERLVGKPGAFWKSLDAYDHVETARAIDEPLFFLQGGRDFEVTVEDDLERWRSELADRPATTIETYDELNHLFMPGSGPSVGFEYSVRNNVAERVVDDVADWIDGH